MFALILGNYTCALVRIKLVYVSIHIVARMLIYRDLYDRVVDRELIRLAYRID